LVGPGFGTLAFISLGVALGTVLPSGHAAQGLGLTLFFPMFLLAGGGPPPQALSDVMQSISQWLPLTHAIRAAQEPWLDLGTGGGHLVIVVGIFVASTAVWVIQSARVSRRARSPVAPSVMPWLPTILCSTRRYPVSTRWLPSRQR